MRHAPIGRADHAVSTGGAHRERHVDERNAELQYVIHQDAGCPDTIMVSRLASYLQTAPAELFA